MQEIAISKFKATCLAVLENVRKTRTPVRVTRFGKPVADILPPSQPPKTPWLGCLRDSVADVSDDIVGPIGAFKGWGGRRP
jgi:antitoxin (DNA-binding transcriptional repressor) of toxin-antitoxin stability system